MDALAGGRSQAKTGAEPLQSAAPARDSGRIRGGPIKKRDGGPSGIRTLDLRIKRKNVSGSARGLRADNRRHHCRCCRSPRKTPIGHRRSTRPSETRWGEDSDLSPIVVPVPQFVRRPSGMPAARSRAMTRREPSRPKRRARGLPPPCPAVTAVRMAWSPAWSPPPRVFSRAVSRSRSVRRFAWFTRRPPDSRRQRSARSRPGAAPPARRPPLRQGHLRLPPHRPASSHRIGTGSGGQVTGV